MCSGGQRAYETQILLAPAHLAARQQVLEAQIAHADGNQPAADQLTFDAHLANVGRIDFAPPPSHDECDAHVTGAGRWGR